MEPRRYHVLLNAQSGAAAASGLTADTLRGLFAAAGLEASVDADTDRPLTERIEAALASDADVLVSAGGDGTATLLASRLAGTDKALALLPLGTANLLARDLKLPLDLEGAVSILKDLHPRRIDVGEVNGRVFLHKVVIGFVPGIAAGREQMRGRPGIGAWFAFTRYALRRVSRAGRLAVEIASDEAPPRIERLMAVAVGNNSYDEGLGRFFSRSRLDGGSLSVYVLQRLTVVDLARLVAGMALGRWKGDAVLSIASVHAVSIRSKRPRLKAMIDGEVETLSTPLDFAIRPASLLVLAPAADAGTAPDPSPGS